MLDNMEVDSAINSENNDDIQVLSDFDIEQQLFGYTDRGRLCQLMYIADHCSSLRKDALVLAADMLRNTLNTYTYRQIAMKLQALGVQGVSADEKWIETKERLAAQTNDRLNSELTAYKANLIKESIRMGHNELANLYYSRGDLEGALKAFCRTQDYCTSSKHLIDMCLNVVKCCIELKKWHYVLSYIGKAEKTPVTLENYVIAQLDTGSGIAALMMSHYKEAANKLLDIKFEHANRMSDVISAQDIAIFGSICALATFERTQLKKRVLENAEFKAFLELTPKIRALLQDFYATRYSSALKYLDSLKSEFLLNMYLGDHVQKLFILIRNKAIKQYFSPFSSVNLKTMAVALNCSVSDLEKELVELIIDGSITARIDSHNKVLYAELTNERKQTWKKSLATGEEFEMDTKNMILRLNLIKDEFIVGQERKRRDVFDKRQREKGY